MQNSENVAYSPLESICLRHRAFAAYWHIIGSPPLERRPDTRVGEDRSPPRQWDAVEMGVTPGWFEHCEYRIKGDKHWKVRNMWIYSGFSVPIEIRTNTGQTTEQWDIAEVPFQFPNADYRIAPTQKYSERPDYEAIVSEGLAKANASIESLGRFLDVHRPEVDEFLQPEAESTQTALDVQVGGGHYKKFGIYQPWEVYANWFNPQELKGAMKKEVITYLCREEDKGGAEDIEKAAHTMLIYAELLRKRAAEGKTQEAYERAELMRLKAKYEKEEVN